MYHGVIITTDTSALPVNVQNSAAVVTRPRDYRSL